MEDYIDAWKKNNLSFDCIYSGFLGSIRQIGIVSDFIDYFGNEENLVVVDPVMGDNGTLYSSFNDDFIPQMRSLIKKADLITPNYTEAAFLLGKESRPEEFTDETAKKWLRELSDMGPAIVVITSAPDIGNSENTNVIAYDRENDMYWKVGCRYIPANYPGTGDTFTSVVIGSLLQQESLPVALDRGTQFISQCIKASYRVLLGLLRLVKGRLIGLEGKGFHINCGIGPHGYFFIHSKHTPLLSMEDNSG